MKVIMLKDVGGVGQRGSIKEVSDGYGMNYLIARGLAEQATPKKLAEAEERAKHDSELAAQDDAIRAGIIEKLNHQAVEILAKVNDSGHLYKQLAIKDIAEAILGQYKIRIETAAIKIDHPIKEAGESTVEIKLGSHTAKMKVTVRADKKK